jgi:NTE family protein
MTGKRKTPSEKVFKQPQCPPGPEDKQPGVKTINVAIQGGGAHGAYSWGVIDALLEDGRIDIEGISGTSAGSMNGVVLAYGNMLGGSEGARQALHDFWQKISKAGAIYSPLKQMPWEYSTNYLTKNWNLDNSLSYQWFNIVSGMLSPYQFNPYNINPLRKILEEAVDFTVLKQCQTTKLFIATTKVRTGKVRVFRTEEITADVVMASACLPMLFQAVKIGDDYYWDGGYMGNPALFPLFHHTASHDILILHINPIERDELPRSAADIMNRVNEISFNSSLLKEMRAIAFVTRLIEEQWLKEEYQGRLKKLFMHSLRADDTLSHLSVASKFNTDWRFLLYLRDLGREATRDWLEQNFASIGERSTVDLRAEFLDLGAEHQG